MRAKLYVLAVTTAVASGVATWLLARNPAASNSFGLVFLVCVAFILVADYRKLDRAAAS